MRVKTGFTRRHRHQKVLTRTKGMRMTRGKLYKVSKQADLHAGQYAYHGRRLKKRPLRSLWITRITAALVALFLCITGFTTGCGGGYDDVADSHDQMAHDEMDHWRSAVANAGRHYEPEKLTPEEAAWVQYDNWLGRYSQNGTQEALQEAYDWAQRAGIEPCDFEDSVTIAREHFLSPTWQEALGDSYVGVAWAEAQGR